MAEVIIYQANEALEIPLPIVKQSNRGIPSVLNKIAWTLAAIGISIIFFTYAPGAWYSVVGKVNANLASFTLSTKEVQILNSQSKPIVAGQTNVPKFVPPFDPALPTSAHLSIASIGVDTTLQEATYDNYEEALKKGVWRVSNFGSPDTPGMPMILAAHRFGYLAWTNLYRKENSFFNLPKVKVGDMVTVIWRQRKYTYEVYATAKDTEIKDYTADLILYTCEELVGPERAFVYARLMPV